MEADTLISFNHTIEALRQYADTLRQRYQNKLTEDDHVASGNLLRSVEYRVNAGSKSIEINLNLEDYWKYVESGTKPQSAILQWIKVKPVIPSRTYNGKLPTQEQLAFLIARKISEKGTEGTNDLEQSRDELDGTLDEILEQSITQDVNECLDRILVLG